MHEGIEAALPPLIERGGASGGECGAEDGVKKPGDRERSARAKVITDGCRQQDEEREACLYQLGEIRKNSFALRRQGWRCDCLDRRDWRRFHQAGISTETRAGRGSIA